MNIKGNIIFFLRLFGFKESNLSSYYVRENNIIFNCEKKEIKYKGIIEKNKVSLESGQINYLVTKMNNELLVTKYYSDEAEESYFVPLDSDIDFRKNIMILDSSSKASIIESKANDYLAKEYFEISNHIPDGFYEVNIDLTYNLNFYSAIMGIDNDYRNASTFTDGNLFLIITNQGSKSMISWILISNDEIMYRSIHPVWKGNKIIYALGQYSCLQKTEDSKYIIKSWQVKSDEVNSKVFISKDYFIPMIDNVDLTTVLQTEDNYALIKQK